MGKTFTVLFLAAAFLVSGCANSPSVYQLKSDPTVGNSSSTASSGTTSSSSSFDDDD